MMRPESAGPEIYSPWIGYRHHDPESKMIYTPNTKEWATIEQKGGGDDCRLRFGQTRRAWQSGAMSI